MSRIFKALSILLTYPTEGTAAAVPELKAIISAEETLPARQRRRLCDLADEFATRDLLDLQERYVLLFDRSRSLALHLFEHVHGESRQRGQAMVDLASLYERHGMLIEARELPDYLPLFLEFLSSLPMDEACALLDDPAHIIGALGERLRKRKSSYWVVFKALQGMAHEAPQARDVEALLADPDPEPDDLEALDKAWEDEPVTFGPGAAGTVAPDGSCPVARDTLSRMIEPRAPLTGKERRHV